MILCFQLPHQPDGAGSHYALLLFEISHLSSISQVVIDLLHEELQLLADFS